MINCLTRILTPDQMARYAALEEYGPGLDDRFGRRMSYGSRYSPLDPGVSRALFVNGATKRRYPTNAEFAVCLTHDIDQIGLSSHPLLKYLPPRRLNFSQVVNMEEEYGATSTWFVITDPAERHRYSLDLIKPHLIDMISTGHEIGLHGGVNTDRDPERILAQRLALTDALGIGVPGYRSHFLTFSTPASWLNLARCGFTYDTTWGYADCIGYRNGMCHPFRPYNLLNRSEIDIIEIPMVMMDCTLTGYMNLSLAGARDCITRILRTVRDLHGAVTVNWHNHVIHQDPRLYSYLLDTCAEMGAWMPTCSELVEFWRDGR